MRSIIVSWSAFQSTKSISSGAQYVILHIKNGWRKSNLYRFESGKWFWLSIIAQVTMAGTRRRRITLKGQRKWMQSVQKYCCDVFLQSARLPVYFHLVMPRHVLSPCYAFMNTLRVLHIVKDVGMRNEASPESMRPVIRPVILPLSIRPVVHADGHPGSFEVASCTPSLCWVWHCSFLPTKNGKEINQEENNNNLRWWCCCCRNVAS